MSVDSTILTAETKSASDQLPEGWCIATLNDIAAWGSGGTPSRKNSQYYGGNIPWVKTGDLGPRVVMAASEFITEEAVANSSAKFFPKGSVALAMYGATIGKTSILGIDATTNQACGVGNPIPGATTTNYLYYLLRNEKDAFIAKGKGGAQPNISQALIKEHEIRLPPLAEQTVIAQTLDTLLTQAGNIKSRLDAIPKILKTFRQSVLAVAVSGKLTEGWRAENKPVSKWVSDFDLQKTELETFPYEVPEGWCWDHLGNAVTVHNGKRIPLKKADRDKRSGKYPYYGAFGVIDDIDDFLFDGEYLLLAEDGKNLEARVRPIAIRVNGKFWVNNHAHVLKQNEEMELDFLLLALNSPTVSIDQFLTGQDQVKLNKKSMILMPVPVPSLEEQTQIIHRVEELFAFAYQIEQQVKNAQGRVNNLTQSILAKAFRGELTTQWRAGNPDLISGENSAQALLAAIQEEQHKLKFVKKSRKVKINKVKEENDLISIAEIDDPVERILTEKNLLTPQEMYDFYSGTVSLGIIFSSIARLLKNGKLVEEGRGDVKVYSLNK